MTVQSLWRDGPPHPVGRVTTWLASAPASALLGVLVAALAYWRRALTFDGALAAAAIGSLTLACGRWPAAGALVAFFVSSSALSRLGEQRKRAVPLAQSKGSRRDAWQVLANGGVATLCAAVGRPDGLLGALAAAGADTWATELGLLSRTEPRLITTLQRVPAGTSGGVTPLGLAASIAGALIVGLGYLALGGARTSPSDEHPRTNVLTTLRRALLAGLVGTLVDSLLGVTCQADYWCARCQQSTEDRVHARCKTVAELRRGLGWMTNDTVNALATFCGAAVGVLAGGPLKRPNAAGQVRGGS